MPPFSVNIALFDPDSLTVDPNFKLYFHHDLSDYQVADVFTALADYYRACGGTGFEVTFQADEASVPLGVHG